MAGNTTNLANHLKRKHNITLSSASATATSTGASSTAEKSPGLSAANKSSATTSDMKIPEMFKMSQKLSIQWSPQSPDSGNSRIHPIQTRLCLFGDSGNICGQRKGFLDCRRYCECPERNPGEWKCRSSDIFEEKHENYRCEMTVILWIILCGQLVRTVHCSVLTSSLFQFFLVTSFMFYLFHCFQYLRKYIPS